MTPPPDVNTLVYIRVAGSEIVMRSRVEGGDPGRLALALPSDGRTEHRLPVRSELTIEWMVGRGLGSVEGLVTGHADLGVQTLTVELVSDVVLKQRRDYARADLILPVEIWPDAECDEPVAGMTLDVSGGGLRAVLQADLEAGELVRIAVELPEGHAVEGLARVIGQRDDCTAFQFHDIVPADRERLIKAVFASHRRDAAVRRPDQ